MDEAGVLIGRYLEWFGRGKLLPGIAAEPGLRGIRTQQKNGGAGRCRRSQSRRIPAMFTITSVTGTSCRIVWSLLSIVKSGGKPPGAPSEFGVLPPAGAGTGIALSCLPEAIANTLEIAERLHAGPD